MSKAIAALFAFGIFTATLAGHGHSQSPTVAETIEYLDRKLSVSGCNTGMIDFSGALGSYDSTITTDIDTHIDTAGIVLRVKTAHWKTYYDAFGRIDHDRSTDFSESSGTDTDEVYLHQLRTDIATRSYRPGSKATDPVNCTVLYATCGKGRCVRRFDHMVGYTADYPWVEFILSNESDIARIRKALVHAITISGGTVANELFD